MNISLTYIFSNISNVFWFTNASVRRRKVLLWTFLFLFLTLWEWSKLVFCDPLPYALRNQAGVSPKGPQEEKVESILHDSGQEWKTHLSWVLQKKQGKATVTKQLESFHRRGRTEKVKKKKVRMNKGGREESDKMNRKEVAKVWSEIVSPTTAMGSGDGLKQRVNRQTHSQLGTDKDDLANSELHPLSRTLELSFCFFFPHQTTLCLFWYENGTDFW